MGYAPVKHFKKRSTSGVIMLFIQYLSDQSQIFYSDRWVQKLELVASDCPESTWCAHYVGGPELFTRNVTHMGYAGIGVCRGS